MADEGRIFGVGLRGAGQVARQHAAAIAANPQLRLAAVCSRSLESAERLAREFAAAAKQGAPVRVFRHYADMLDDAGVDHRVGVHAQPPARAGSRRRLRRGQARDPRKARRHRPRGARPSRRRLPQGGHEKRGRLRAALAPAGRDDQGPARTGRNRRALLRGLRLLARDQAELPELRVDSSPGVCRGRDDHRRLPRGRPRPLPEGRSSRGVCLLDARTRRFRLPDDVLGRGQVPGRHTRAAFRRRWTE